jgi:hypothetical protein
MQYFVSDTHQLPKKFGKWYYHHDEECHVHETSTQLVIYGGYLIERDIHEVVRTDVHAMEQENGCYFAVVLTKDDARVIVDYFNQTKVFWRNNGRIEFTNTIYLMPLTKADLDMKEIVRRLSLYTQEQINYEPKETFERWEEFIINAPTHGRGTQALEGFYVSDQYAGIDVYQHTPGMKQYDKTQCMTLFRDVYMLEPDHMLVTEGDSVRIRRIHNTYNDLMEAMRAEPEYTDQDELERCLHECFQSHADSIKRQYAGKHIVSSVSEGIDSVVQDFYFDDVKKVSYSFDPPNCPVEYKQRVVDYWSERGREVQWDVLDISTDNIAEITRRHLKDPTCFYWDCIPTYWQMGSLDRKPDLILYGQCGDNMFLHKAFFYYEYMFAQQNLKTHLNAEQKLAEFDRELERFRDCYSAADNILQVQKSKTWQDAYPDMTKQELMAELEAGHPDDYMHDFTKKATPPLYNREVSHNTNTMVTSLYCDRRIFFKILNASDDIMLANIRDAASQKNILKKYFGWEFKTPSKDQSELNCVGMRLPMHTDVVRECLKDHLPPHDKR